MRIGPVAFLLIVPAIWAVARAIMLWPTDPPLPQPVAWAKRLPQRTTPASPKIALVFSDAAVRSAPPAPTRVRQMSEIDSPALVSSAPVSAPASSEITPSVRVSVPQPDHVSSAPPQSVRPLIKADRFSLSAWALLRGDASPALAAGGQLGGSQAGLRARFAFNDRVHLAGRLSAPLRGGLGKEAAVALDIRPFASLPITMTFERRTGLDRGGRDAFGVGVFGGFDRRVGSRMRIDGYGQAGVVGLKRRDLYIDGALRAAHDLTGEKPVRLGVGAGIWGGAQPGAERLDLGPQLVVRTSGVRIGAEWRQRVAGRARPGSGPVLSLGADF